MISTSLNRVVLPFCALGLFLCPVEALAKKHPANSLKRQVIVSSKRMPRSGKSVRAYVKALRKLKTKRFQEDKESQSWKVYFAAFFARPLNDLEVTIKLYDVTPGLARKMVASFEQYLDRRGERMIMSELTLERKTFGVNRRLRMVVENRRVELASTTFEIAGKVEKFSGEVDFTKDEPEGKAKK